MQNKASIISSDEHLLLDNATVSSVTSVISHHCSCCPLFSSYCSLILFYCPQLVGCSGSGRDCWPRTSVLLSLVLKLPVSKLGSRHFISSDLAFKHTPPCLLCGLYCVENVICLHTFCDYKLTLFTVSRTVFPDVGLSA